MKCLEQAITEGYRITDTSVVIAVRLTPKASVNKIEGWHKSDDDKTYLKARVRALPDKGKANKALIDLLAKNLGITKNKLKLVSGSKYRLKMIEVEDNRELILKQLKQM